MKKLILILPIYFYSIFTCFAQDSLQATSGQDSFKASVHSFTTELNVNPFKGELSLNNAFNQIKFRYFISDRTALRLAFTANTARESINNSSAYGTNPFKNEEVKKATAVGLNLGIEKHFAGTKRLSPYVGAEILVNNKSSSHDITTSSSSTKIKGAWQQYVYNGNPNNPNFTYSYIERGFTQYGLNLITGFDFYMAKHFYFGYEITLGFSQTKYKDIDVSNLYTSGGGGNPNNIDTDDTSFSLGPNLINGIRIGYVF